MRQGSISSLDCGAWSGSTFARSAHWRFSCSSRSFRDSTSSSDPKSTSSARSSGGAGCELRYSCPQALIRWFFVAVAPMIPHPREPGGKRSGGVRHRLQACLDLGAPLAHLRSVAGPADSPGAVGSSGVFTLVLLVLEVVVVEVSRQRVREPGARQPFLVQAAPGVVADAVRKDRLEARQLSFAQRTCVVPGIDLLQPAKSSTKGWPNAVGRPALPPRIRRCARAPDVASSRSEDLTRDGALLGRTQPAFG